MEWVQVRAEWEIGEASLEELSHKHGVSRRALQMHFKKHGCEKGSQSKIVAQEVKEAVFAEFGADREERVRLGREARATEFDNARRIERLIMAQLGEKPLKNKRLESHKRSHTYTKNEVLKGISRGQGKGYYWALAPIGSSPLRKTR